MSEYRLVGYENRVLAREDFDNDKVDAGEIGAGHSITALYELALRDEGGERVMPLRYGSSGEAEPAREEELAHLRLRFKRPDVESSELLTYTILHADLRPGLADTSDDYRFTAAVAAFGQQLRGGKYLQAFGYDEIERLALGARGGDRFGYRSDLLRLVRLARGLQGQG